VEGKTIAVWFSCGAASAVAAKKTIERYGKDNTIRVINNPVKEEDADNMRFLKDVEKWLGVDIEFAVNPKYPNCSAVEVWNKRQYMAGNGGAPCTLELKKEARYAWERNNPVDYHVLGFTVDEWDRARNFTRNEKANSLWVLGYEQLTKEDCFRIVKDAGLELPRIYGMGYPNANCIGCVKATSPTYWNHVRQMHPEIFEDRAKQSREIGARLVRVKGQRIFLDELDPTATGRPMKNMNFECGIFCEEI
jgi:hypothetical protein